MNRPINHPHPFHHPLHHAPRRPLLLSLLLAAALLGACVPDDIYWLPDNRHLIAMRDRPMLIDTQDGTEHPLVLPGLDDKDEIYFTALPDLRRLAVFTKTGAVIYDQRTGKDDRDDKAKPAGPAPEFIKRRVLNGAGFGFGKLLSPSGDRLIGYQENPDNDDALILSVWDIRTGKRRNITQYADTERDFMLQAYWLDEDRIAVMFMHEIESTPDSKGEEEPLFKITAECILHDLATDTTRTLAAKFRLTEDSWRLDTIVPDPGKDRLIITAENRITFLDVQTGEQRHIYPYRMLEAEWPLYFAAITGPRYNAGLDMMTFTGMERPGGGANIFTIDLARTEELPLNPFPWLTQEKRNVRAAPAVPLTHFRQMAAFYAATSPRGDKIACFVNTQNRPGVLMQRGQRVQMILADNRDEKLKMISDLNDKRDRLFTTLDDATRANDWAEWAVKIINDGLREEKDDEAK